MQSASEMFSPLTSEPRNVDLDIAIFVPRNQDAALVADTTIKQAKWDVLLFLKTENNIFVS